MIRKAILSSTILSIAALSVSAAAPVADTKEGVVQGIEQLGVTVYKGIPYAQPPVGALRWKRPQPPVSHSDTLVCDQFAPASIQADHQPGSFYWKEFYQGGDPERSEDCLYLNIWTPSSEKNDLPVIVWVHGGGYMAGYGHEIEFDGTEFAKRGVILVTLNYRLGALGFLAHPALSAENPDKASGNYGLYDQAAAIDWVYGNIASFGGDPDNITVMGQSAGAGSVQALVSSPLTKGKIAKAIIMSGGGLDGIIQPSSLQAAEAVGAAMLPDMTAERMRALSPQQLNEYLMDYMTGNPGGGLPFGPTVDGVLLPESFKEIACQGRQHNIPYMIGYTAQDIAPEVMRNAAMQWSFLLESQGRKGAYVYCFAHDLPGEDMEPNPALGVWGDMSGAFHSSELWYVFGTLRRCWRPMTDADYALSHQMINAWSNFARKSDPNADGCDDWQLCTKDNPAIRTFDNAVVLSTPQVTASRINDRFTVIETDDRTTLYMVEGRDRALLIDTGTRIDSLDVIVKRLTDKPVECVITHLHPDHAGNIGFFDEVWMHPADTVMLHEYAYAGKIKFLNDRDSFDLGGKVIETALMPGHTPGSIVLFDRATGDCFTGDAFGNGGVWMQLEPHVPMSEYVHTCADMERLIDDAGIKYLWPGHYPYVKTYFPPVYVARMKEVARRISTGDTSGARPYPVPKSMHSMGSPYYLMDDQGVSVVYNADKIN